MEDSINSNIPDCEPFLAENGGGTIKEEQLSGEIYIKDYPI